MRWGGRCRSMAPMLLTDLPALETLRTPSTATSSRPADDGWDEARAAWNLAADQRPAAVAFPLTDSDVVAVVNFARENDLRVAPQGTGHGAAALESLEDAILLSTRHMRGVRIDPRARRARVRAGALWEDVTSRACSTASRRWPARARTSRSSATRSAAG